MAEEKKHESSSLTTALPVTVVMATLAGLFFTQTLPYQDERPSNHPLQERYSAPAQDVDARLWQDPFAAVDGVSDESPMEGVTIVATQMGKSLRLDATRKAANLSYHTQKQIYKNYDENKPAPRDKITILAVTLPGGPYQEAAEERMRRRYAVLSALANQGVVPEDGQHIGYFNPERIDLQKKVPFEWWLLPKSKKKILLLWADESSLRDKPAAKLKALLTQASNQKISEGKEIIEGQFDYAVIGPNTSTLLQDMLKEVVCDANSTLIADCPKSDNSMDKGKLGEIQSHEIVYYSAGATASDESLLQGIVLEPKCSFKISECLDFGKVKLKRITATDDAMMRVLVEELGIRRVEKTDHVVILSEWDTFYGRAMPETFKKLWEKNDEEENKTVHPYSYMRGLDGKLPDKSDKGDKAGSVMEKKSDSKDKSGSDALIELPEGQTQKDYLRRLTDEILELDQYLKNYQGNMKGVAAIGVLGSDVHDKLMIMEALRQHFPHKLFFTTDLNAVYNHPAKWPQTHNLLVASAFDLKLRHELQDKIPPFRDSYQTAFFLAVQIALKDKAGIADHIVIPPRLFEIGRSHPVPLSWGEEDKISKRIKDNGKEIECSWKKLSSCNTLQPRIFTTFQLNCPWEGKFNCLWEGKFNWPWKGMMVVVFLAMIPPLVSWRIRGIVRGGMRDIVSAWMSNPYGVVLCVGIVLFLAYLFPLWWNHYFTQFNAEPLYWLEGVSAWPSQLLRLSAFLFAVMFFFWGRTRIQKMQNELQVQSLGNHKSSFSLPENPSLVEDCDVLFIGSWESKMNNELAVLPDDLWKRYLGYCHQKKFCFRGSFWRVMLHGLVFLGAGISLMLWSGFPNTPTRGDTALYWHRGILIVAVVATVMLTMWVVENARLCAKLITRLSAKPSNWNRNAKDWAIHKKKVAPECVEEYLDIKFVARLTETMQPLIWGPMVCLGLLVLARSPAMDDWDMSWGLCLVFIVMLLYAISAEVFLQFGAKLARAKAIDLLTGKIRERRNQPNLEDSGESVIKQIDAEIERIRSLREGAFSPWYELPLIRSFGGLGTLVIVLQYLAVRWGGGGF